MIRLPQTLISPAAWKGEEIQSKPECWVFELKPEEVTELTDAVRKFIKSQAPLETISKSQFTLPALGARLAEIKTDLVRGMGFKLIRGLDSTQFTRQEIATLFMGLGTHIGMPRSQNADGHLLGHVRNIGADASDTNTRIYQTNARQTFHTDSADVVGLVCLQTALSGGESLLVSAETIYNEMLKQRPDLAMLLFEPVATDKRGEVELGTKPYFSIPVFSWYKGKLTVIYQRQYIESAQRFEGVPAFTPEYIEALDLFDQLANDSRLNISMQLQAGDIQFVHNHSMLHDRGAFEDWPDLDKRRHLLRLWLTVPGDRPLPPVFTERFGTVDIGNRGGVVVENTRFQVLLD